MVLHSRIEIRGQTRDWINHGDALIGVRLDPFADHLDVARIGAFVRTPNRDEHSEEGLRPLEQPAFIVKRTCVPQMIKRTRVGFAPNHSPFPDWYDASEDETWKRPLTDKIVGQAKRL